jgi:hypothetical protein
MNIIVAGFFCSQRRIKYAYPAAITSQSQIHRKVETESHGSQADSRVAFQKRKPTRLLFF